MHVALGGCLKPPPISYGITQDTGGHIAYVLGAASAQAASERVTRVTIVTRAFDEPELGADYGKAYERVGERLCIRRLRTACPRYLSKSSLAAELPALGRAFLEMVDADVPDVIHAHFADAAELALEAARRHRVPVLYTPHSLALDKRARCGTSLGGRGGDPSGRLVRERRAIAEADAIVVSSDDEARRQIAAYDDTAGERCVVVRPGVHLRPSVGTELASELVEPFLDDPRRPFLLAIARPVPKKNLPMLLEAYARSGALRARADLVILAGQHERIRRERDEQTRELDRLHALVSRYRLAGSVALPPSHAPEAVAQLYRLAVRRRGLFVNPARHEPFGLTLIEAARFGLPVVATRRGGPRDIVANVGHGRLVDPDDPDEIARACEAMFENAGEYDAAARAARERNGLYGWEGWAESVGEVIARLREGVGERDGGAVRGRLGRDVDEGARETTVHGIARGAPSEAPGHRRALIATGEEAIRLPALDVAHGPAPSRARVSARRGTAIDGAAERSNHFLAFDIDDTLTGCRRGAELFRRWVLSRRPGRLPFAVATGRELPEAMAVIERWRLPRPDVWLTSVGTEIWRPAEAGGLVRCAAWAGRLDVGWDRAAILHRLRALDVRYQAARTQRPWKVSLFGGADAAARVTDTFAACADTVRVVASHGRFIDIVPRRAGKASAIEFEAARHGIPMTRCVSAGNSGNDADMLRRCGKAILVANALPEVVGIVDRDRRDGLYRTSAPHARGVLEGLAVFGLTDESGPVPERSESTA